MGKTIAPREVKGSVGLSLYSGVAVRSGGWRTTHGRSLHIFDMAPITAINCNVPGQSLRTVSI